MKKSIFIAALMLSNCYLKAQTNNTQKDSQNNSADILLLQKSNALLKNQLNDQNQNLLQEIRKTDIIITILQTANNEIQQEAEKQNAISKSINNLNEHTKNISQSFSKRKLYAIIAIIGGIFLVLIYLIYVMKKLSAINNNIKQKEEDLNKNIAQINDNNNSKIDELRVRFEKQIKETNQTMDGKILTVKEIFQDQISQSANEFNKKLTELNKSTDTKNTTNKNGDNDKKNK